MADPALDNANVLNILRRRWASFALLCLLVCLTSYMILRQVWGFPYAMRWLGLASFVEIYLSVSFWQNLQSNHRPGESQLLSSLGAGNRMTLVRGLLTAAFIGFLFSPRPDGWLGWLPGILYTLICVADILDGYLARLTNHVTDLGERLDMRLDGLGVLAASFLVVQYGQVPTWFILVGLARYCFLAGESLRRLRGKTLYSLPYSLSRRATAGLMMGFMAVVLWPIFTPPGSFIAAALFALPFLIGFTFDFLVVCGVRKPPAEGVQNRWNGILHRNLPVLIRGLVLLLALYLYNPLQNSASPPYLIIAGSLFAMLVVLGVAGRTFAASGLILLGIQQSYTSVEPSLFLLGALYIAILYLGTGNLSIWQPEDRLIYGKAGERALPARIEQPA